MSSTCPTHSHTCKCSSTVATQSLDEMEFERGIWFAAQYGELDKVRKLVESGKSQVDQLDSAGYTALHYAARNGHMEVCKYLADKGSNINIATRAGQATALHRAASAGRKDIVSYLLTKKANGKLMDADGKTALKRAIENNHKEIAKLLESYE